MRCKEHPRYKAIFEPRCGCFFCWQMWRDRLYDKDRKARRHQIKILGEIAKAQHMINLLEPR